jgi:hypothetical protein
LLRTKRSWSSDRRPHRRAAAEPEFFVEAYELRGPLADAVLWDCGLDDRDTLTGGRLERRNR